MTPGSTWNPIRGCTKVSPGCSSCYAETFAERFRGVKGHPYEQGFDLRLVPDKLTEPLSWKKPRRVFVNSMSDLFQDGVPDAFIDQVFAVMALTPRHTYQVLTKRPERMRLYLNPDRDLNAYCRVRKLVDSDAGPNGITDAWWKTLSRFEQEQQRQQWWTRLKPDRWPLPNVWLGVSVENQHFADERIPLLLQTPAAVRFISAEPLLDFINLCPWIAADWSPTLNWWKWSPVKGGPTLDWVIVGGESGPSARPCRPHWIRSIVGPCQAAKVPVFVKQLGANVIDRNDAGFEGDTPRSWPMDTETRDLTNDGWQGDPVRVTLHKKGGDMAEWPGSARRCRRSRCWPDVGDGPPDGRRGMSANWFYLAGSICFLIGTVLNMVKR